MKAVEANLLKFIQSGEQFVIPIYQRTYSWQEQECEQLWQDIVRSAADSSITGHFVGSVVYIEEAQSNASRWSPYLVIDGQQRLTTVSLILAALGEALGEGETSDGFTARKIRNLYLTNPEETGERRFKLLLSQTDKPSLCAIVGQAPMPKESSIRVAANYEFFLKRLKGTQELQDRVWAGLAKLMIVDVSLTRGQDNPQLVFESLNSTGRELSQADLIRNYVLMSLEPDLQTRLYEQYWRPMEVEFGQEGYVWHFDGFMRHYLTVRTGEIPNVRDVYSAFKTYSQSGKVDGVEAIVTEIRDYARFFCAMALGTESDPELKLAFHDLRELRVDVAYPFLLELYADFHSGLLSKPDFLAAVRLVESYVFRRAICEIPTNSLNKTFATFGRDLKKDRYLESIQAKFLLLPSYRRFPRDDEFRRQLQVRDLYHFRSRSYWLRRMENHDRKERVPVDEYTIEHIMPQNEDMRPEWKIMLGEEWERIHGMRLHTLGNLTLTGYNTEYSDRPFHEKRDMKGGFAESPLRMNAGLGSLEVWDEEAILARAERLAGIACNVWESPKAESLNLNEFQPPKQAEATQYTLDSYPQLKSEPVKALFDAIRKEILGLDPVVAEVCRFGYVAYKAETNFVDVEPQSKRLKLFLNIPFADLNDSRGIARDVTNIGTWGNGDVEVVFDNLEEIPYVMGLVRQSFERQISAGDQ
ncbi:MAG TPA: DUF262 and DUF1524 domain-containing protein [Fimbriimonadaceae bacterium]|nr:DUF262 and DUF1524 domain-containing protein [Fimbriimonadaceae bacterium]